MSQVNDSDNIYAMSDEDLLKTDLDHVPSQEEQTQVAVPETTPEEVQVEEVVPDAEINQEQVVTPPPETPPGEVVTPEVVPPEPEVKTVEGEIDYKSFYDAITKPFVANGKEVQVAKPEDITRLMQQGAGYHKKMEAIKPLKRINKLLEDNGLLDESDLNYLIDIHHKKPEAIAKLIKDSDIDLFEFDVTKGEGYTPSQRTVNDEAIELQTVLDDLKQNSPSYDQTINVLGNQWDASSREVLAQHPELIRIIDSQVQDGTFAKVNQAVEHQRMLGNLQGIPDLQAYKQVGEQLFGTGSGQTQPQQQQTTVPPVVIPPTHVTTPQVNNTTEQRKKAAAPPRTSTATTNQQNIDISTLSDADLLKAMGSNQ